MEKIGRNDACPCGSGKKYKQCCMPGDVLKSAMPSPPPQNKRAETVTARQMDEIAGLYNAGRHAEFENKARALVDEHPESGYAWRALGIALRTQGKDALSTLQKAVQFSPNDADIINTLGNAQKDLGQLNEAALSYRRALVIKPAFPEAHSNLGEVLRDLGQLRESEETLRSAIKINPRLLNAHFNLGNTLRDLGELDEAIASYHRAIKINPNLAQIHNNLGIALSDQGRLEEAATAYEMAVSLKPDYIDPHFGLSSLKTYRDSDPHLAMLERLLDKADALPMGTRIIYWFALGKVREDLGRYDESFAAYRQGNLLKHAVLPSNELAKDLFVDRIISVFSKDFFAEHRHLGFKDKAPIFIVGMPRSGTSLLEQILATCPGVYGAGELADIQNLVTTNKPEEAIERFPNSVPRWLASDFRRLGEQYVERVWKHAPDAERVTDKMPSNFFYLGLIHLMLPNAKIIHAMRDPMDSCFSCYSRIFQYDDMDYTYDLETLGHFYARYSKLMQHWHAVLPAGTILNVRYEDMVENTESQARRLLKYLDVPWDERCLAFYQNKRIVGTASAAQVRKPIYKTSLARWERFGKHLNPLLELVKDYRNTSETTIPAAEGLGESKDSETLHQLGIAAHRQGNDLRAIELLRQAVIADPDNVDIHNDLGGVYVKEDKLDEAISCFHRALKVDACNANSFYNLGCVLQKQGQLADAETHYRKALAINPAAADILCNLGACLQEQRKLQEAIACYRQVLELKPNDVNSLNNLGLTSYDMGNFDQALSYYRRALAVDPQNAYTHFCIGVTLQALSKLKEALEYYRQALVLGGDQPETYDNLLMLQLFLLDVSQEALFVEHRQFGEHFETALKAGWRTHTNSPVPDKRLKIGYVSGDFRMHAVAYFMEPVLASHDKSQVEIFCYANNSEHDSFTDRLIALADHWQPCNRMSDEQLAERIRADGIDILIDLAGHTSRNRLLVFARKPAPVQITYLGYPGTSGLSAMDYRLTDRNTEPEGSGADRYYTEKLLRLPDSMWCYRPDDEMLEVTPLPALSNGYVTFGSFNSFNKISDDCLALWAALLRNVPTSRLLMVTVPEGEARERLIRLFAGFGVAAERISFCGKLPTHEFQRILQQVDITLDPFPVNGATTTCESLWLGVPVLTLVGDRFLTRAGLSVLSAAQMSDFAVATPEEYIKTAVLLANNLPLLANIRAGLREHLKTTPLLDSQRFTRNIEDIYRIVWRQWCTNGDSRGN